MGTSLFGLTPAATYPSLIKFGDNSAISGVLRALSDGLGNDLPIQVSTAGVNFTGTLTLGGSGLSPASGVAGAIQFSNGSAFASDAANLFWDDTNNRLGVGTNAPSATLQVVGNAFFQYGAGSLAGLLQVGSNAGGFVVNVDNRTDVSLKNNAIMTTRGTGITFRANSGEPNGAVLGVVGSGSTSATTSLLVQNSAGSNAFRVLDDGGVQVLEFIRPTDGTTNSFLRLSNSQGTTMQYAGGFVKVNPSFQYQSASYGDILFMSSTTGQFLLNGGTLENSAQMQINATTKGFLPPRMTTTQKNAIATPAAGLQVFDTTFNQMSYFNGTVWINF